MRTIVRCQYCGYIHASLMSLLYNDKIGRRDNSVWVGNDQYRFTPCDCQLVEPLLNLLFSDWLDSYDIFVKSAIIHFLFVWVHPYFDGNGRTIRIIHKEILIRNGLTKFEGICIDKCIYESRSKYYRAIRDSEEDNDITHFILYMLDVYEECLSEGVE